MMLKRPQWVKEKIEGREKDIPLQMTVKKKYAPQTSYANMPTMGMMTGSGVDGMVQPGKMVDVQVHEGEGIIPNNAMQGLTDEEFQGLVETLSSGNIDKNKLREAMNMPTVTGYQSGGRIIDYTTDPNAAEVFPNVGYEYADEGHNKTTATTKLPENVPSNYSNRDPANRRRFGVSGFEGPEVAPTVTRETTEAPTIQVGPAVHPATIPTKTFTREQPTFEFKPPQPIVEPEVTVEPPAAEEKPETKVPAETETVTQPVTSYAGEMIRQGLQKILAEAQGVSDVDRKIANFYLQNTDASNAANLRKLESQISSDPTMSDQAKQSAIAGLRREAAAQRSQQVGELAVNAAERASKAARDIVTYGGEVRTYDEITLPQARQNLELQRRTFEEYTSPMNELELKQLESELGTQNWDEIQDMIDKNVSIERVNERLAEKGIRPLTIREYANMLEAGSLGERNWNRQLGAAKLAIELGDFKSAAKEFSNLFPGVDFDFTQLETQQKAENFAKGLSQMASYIAADLDFDEALEAMKGDQTLELMGFDENQLAQIYNATKVNALDAEWERIEESQIYQDLLNSDDPQDREDAKNTKLFWTQAVMGLLDWNTLHEYKITDENGNQKGSVFQISPEAAQAEADKLGTGMKIEDTGHVDFAVKTEPETEAAEEEMTAINKLEDIDVGTKEELLDTKNSKLIFDAYNEDPKAFKDSDYYFTFPDENYFKDNITYKTAGKNEMRMKESLKATFEEAVGKIVELPDGTVGQVSKAKEYPNSIQLMVRLKDGTYKPYVVWDKERFFQSE